MGNHLIASSSELTAASIAPGKRDVANRSLEASGSYNIVLGLSPAAPRRYLGEKGSASCFSIQYNIYRITLSVIIHTLFPSTGYNRVYSQVLRL